MSQRIKYLFISVGCLLAALLISTQISCNMDLPDKVDEAVDSIGDLNDKLDQCLDALEGAADMLEICINKECPACPACEEMSCPSCGTEEKEPAVDSTDGIGRYCNRLCKVMTRERDKLGQCVSKCVYALKHHEPNEPRLEEFEPVMAPPSAGY